MILELDSTLMPELIESFQILHFDEYPIVFVGKNRCGTNIIGSFIFEDETYDTLQFFICEISPLMLNGFLRKKINYKTVMANAIKIEIVITDYVYHIENKTVVQYADIDLDMLPSKDSFCPIDVYKEYVMPPPNILSAAEE